MQKLDQIQKFVLLSEGEDACFTHPEGQHAQARLIKMRINAPGAVNLYITPVEIDYETGQVKSHDEDGQIFLAHVAPGFEQIQFHYEGSFCLNSKGGDIWLDTYDNTLFNIEASDPTSFARLFEREERHPAILEMERMARYNQEALRLQNRMEMDAAIAALEKRIGNVSQPSTSAPVGTTSDESNGGTPVPSAPTAGDPKSNPPEAAATGGEPA